MVSTRMMLLALIMVASPLAAQDIFLRAMQIDTLAVEDPSAALIEIDATRLAAQASGESDPRLIFDLVVLKAQLLQKLERPEDAGEALAQAAALAARYRDLLDIDPIPLYREAADLFQAIGRLRDARALLLTILNEQRDGGQPATVLSKTLTDLAALSDLMDNPADAAQYREAARDAADVPISDTRGAGEGYREVEVFYATDRSRSGDPDPAKFYNAGRADLELGLAMVTIPDTHTKGLVESPSIWKLEFGPNPAKHVVLQSVTPVDEGVFYNQMNARLEAKPNKDLFVFIHGYNVGFEQAAKRAAQISYDMNYAGLPVLYSWPSAGSTMGYIADTAVVRLSGRRLSRFLEDLVARSGAGTIHIVAHSMGNRALTDALELMAVRHDLTPASKPIFGQILFAAPDVDAGLFAQMIQTIRPIARRLTLYASDQDWALESSRRLHGNAPRAGQGGEYVLVDENIDSVDMSELGEDMLAHSYFADDSSALADMMSLFWHNTAPYRRCGLQETGVADGAQPYWIYKRGKCQSRTLMDVMALMQRDNAQTPQDVKRILKNSVADKSMRDTIEPVLIRMVTP